MRPGAFLPQTSIGLRRSSTLRRFHHFPFCLQPVTFVITVPASVLKPDVIRTHLNLLPQGRIRIVAVVFVGISICSHLAPRFCFSSTLLTFPKLFIKTRKLANAVFLALLMLLVMPNVQSMELRHLRYFAAVAAHGSFRRAANQLHLTQPALSRQVKSLEEEIGIALVVRGQNAITLTSAGEAFYEEAKDILARVDVAVRRTPKTGPLVKMDFRRSTGEEKADDESKTQTAQCGLQGQSGIRSPGGCAVCQHQTNAPKRGFARFLTRGRRQKSFT